MASILPYLRILRPQNALMAGATTALGFWFSGTIWSARTFLLLIMASMAAVGFGNIVNDIHDIATDRISHPGRPLPRGEISRRAAWIAAVLTAAISLACAWFASPIVAMGAAIPLALLLAYAFRLKATPLAGNLLISLLVAYPLIFGGMLGASIKHLAAPAGLAFLLNMMREIIKDIQDRDGDRRAGLITSAIYPDNLLKSLIVICSAACILGMAFPYMLGHFGTTYIFICLLCLIPLHLYWLRMLFSDTWEMRLATISTLIKQQMLGGLLALAADQAGRLLVYH